jgi:hypothetical protein
MYVITVRGMNELVLRVIKKEVEPTRKYLNSLLDRETNKYGAYVHISVEKVGE